MTNYDRVRQMGKEQFADELLDLFAAFYDVEWSKESIMDWLDSKIEVRCRKCSNYRDEWCDKIHDSPHPDIDRDCQHFRVKTNFDKIRDLSEKEFADWFMRHLSTAEWCKVEELGTCCDDFPCEECMIKWLKSGCD